MRVCGNRPAQFPSCLAQFPSCSYTAIIPCFHGRFLVAVRPGQYINYCLMFPCWFSDISRRIYRSRFCRKQLNLFICSVPGSLLLCPAPGLCKCSFCRISQSLHKAFPMPCRLLDTSITPGAGDNALSLHSFLIG